MTSAYSCPKHPQLNTRVSYNSHNSYNSRFTKCQFLPRFPRLRWSYPEAYINDASKRYRKLGLAGFKRQQGSLDVPGPPKTSGSCNTLRRLGSGRIWKNDEEWIRMNENKNDIILLYILIYVHIFWNILIYILFIIYLLYKAKCVLYVTSRMCACVCVCASSNCVIHCC